MHNDDIETLLRRNLELTKENNRILHKIRRGELWGRFFQIIWIGIFVGVPVFLYYYFFQPYYESLSTSYRQFHEQVGDIPGLSPLLEKFLGDDSTTEAPR